MNKSQLKEIIHEEISLLLEARHDLYAVADNTKFGWRLIGLYEDPEHATQLLRSGEGQYGKLTKAATAYAMKIGPGAGSMPFATLAWNEKKWRNPGKKTKAPSVLYALYNKKDGWPLQGIFKDVKKVKELWKERSITYPGKPTNAPIDQWLNQGGESKIDDSSLFVLKYKMNAAGTEQPKNVSKAFRGK